MLQFPKLAEIGTPSGLSGWTISGIQDIKKEIRLLLSNERIQKITGKYHQEWERGWE